MSYLILKEGFENSVRNRLGVKKSELTDESINDKFISRLAESVVVKRVPHYSELQDDESLMFLESAVMNYICYLLAPTMATKVKYKVSTIEVRWETPKVNWGEMAERFLMAYENDLDNLGVDYSGESQIFTIAKLGGGEE